MMTNTIKKNQIETAKFFSSIKHSLLWKLCSAIAIGAVFLFFLVDILTTHAEHSMSFIADRYQQQLLAYGREAEKIYVNEAPETLNIFLETLQREENTWAVVVNSTITPLGDGVLSEQFVGGFGLGRSVEWKIHLYFEENPIMDIPFADKHTHFLIQLPQRMRPGKQLQYITFFLQFVLPLCLLCLLSLLLYRYVMAPLKKLEKATRQFSAGNFDVRIADDIGDKNKEITLLANTFDDMAERTSQLITNQRQLLADLSHEIRTPLARMDMAIDCVEKGIDPKKSLSRLRYESSTMRELVEDVLTLAWLSNEKPKLTKEMFDLVDLLQVISDDAKFEHTDRDLLLDIPLDEVNILSSQRALGQALENIVRNALRYTQTHTPVLITMRLTSIAIIIVIKDHGLGVPPHLLEAIFHPFFQVDVARPESASPKESDSQANYKRGGFGLGLALAYRQIMAVEGTITAENHYNDINASIAGLQIIITLPRA